MLPYFGLISDFINRIYGYKSLGIGLTYKIHQLTVLVLIYDRNDLFSGGVVICADNLVKVCTAVKI